MTAYTVNCLQTLQKCLMMISSNHSITAIIEGNDIDRYVGVLEVHTELTYHYATYSVWPSPLLVALYLALAAKCLHAPAMVAQ